MDRSEQLAKQYLHHLGFNSVIYEPDGKVPPDFLVDHRIAVEVRRLNQNEITSSGHRGLEETEIPLLMKMKRLLASLGSSDTGVSWFVSYDFSRPLLPWKELQSRIRRELTLFRQSQPCGPRASIAIGDTFEIDLMRAGRCYPKFFLLGGHSDGDSGGWVLHELQKNLQICIDEKTEKIVRVREKYKEWWLVLIDYINYGVDERTPGRQLTIKSNWDKVLLINPQDPRTAYQL